MDLSSSSHHSSGAFPESICARCEILCTFAHFRHGIKYLQCSHGTTGAYRKDLGPTPMQARQHRSGPMTLAFAISGNNEQNGTVCSFRWCDAGACCEHKRGSRLVQVYVSESLVSVTLITVHSSPPR